MEKVLDKVKNTRILAIIGIACLILGTIFPFVKISILGFSETVALTGYWEGYVIMVLALLHVASIFDDYTEKVLPKFYENNLGQKLKTNKKLCLVPTALVVIFLIYTISTLDLNMKYASFDIGFYLLCIGCICLGAYPFVYKKIGITNNTVVNNVTVSQEPIQTVNTDTQANIQEQNNETIQNK